MKDSLGFKFIAEWRGPPQRRLYLWQDPPIRNSDPPYVRSGWSFAVSEFDSNGDEVPFADFWEETYSEIILYPPEYAPITVTWIDESTGLVIDIYNWSHGSTPASSL